MRANPLSPEKHRFGYRGIQARLTALTMIVTLPLLIGVAVYISFQARAEIEAQALNNLQKDDHSLATNVSTWLELHVRSAKEMAILPDIISMDAVRQKPTLVAIAKSHPNLFLVHVNGLDGMDVSRSDNSEPKDYHDRAWFLAAKAGTPIAYEVLISRTINKPALSIATPIYDQSGKVVGVASIISELSEISKEVLTAEQGHSISYIVDETNHVVAHPDPTYTEKELRDLSSYPPIVALNKGNTGKITFTDENGVVWVAYADRLENGWGVVTQQPESELLAPVRQFQTTTSILILIGSVVMFALVWFAVRRNLQPIRALTTTVSAIAAGDLNRIAEVKNQDEIGVLASEFNEMTAKLRESFATLEQRVKQRTSELENRSMELEQLTKQSEKRANDLQTIEEIAHYISTEKEMENLLPLITQTVSQRFGYYHIGIFLLDEQRKFAVLRAANSPGGQVMLKRQHKLEVGQVGIVGNVTSTGNPRIALDTGADAVFFNNPNLPDTHSEMALPLTARGTIIGALDVQSTVRNAFTNQDVSILSLLADQIATAIDNVRLLAETQNALIEAQSLFHSYLADAWQKKSTSEVIGYYQTITGGKLITGKTGKVADLPADAEKDTLAVPIRLRDQVIGTLNVRPSSDGKTWSKEEISIVEAVTERLGLALDNARLFEETSARAARERTVSEITTKIRNTNDPQEIINTAVQELQRALGVSRVEIIPQKTAPSPDK